LKKRSFLIPVATLLSALSASNVDAGVTRNLVITHIPSESFYSAAFESSNAFDFIMVQGDYVDVTARHRSHSSHRSHRSHFSSR
jgi:hypothetical protein